MESAVLVGVLSSSSVNRSLPYSLVLPRPVSPARTDIEPVSGSAKTSGGVGSCPLVQFFHQSKDLLNWRNVPHRMTVVNVSSLACTTCDPLRMHLPRLEQADLVPVQPDYPALAVGQRDDPYTI